VDSNTPPVIADYANESYAVNSGGSPSASNFSDMHSYTGASLKTMFPSGGSLSWAPHNLLTYSGDFTNAAWAKTNVTITEDADGEADLIECSESSGDAFLQQSTTVSSGEHTFEVRLKKGVTDWALLLHTHGGVFDTYFDLDNGVVGATNDAQGSIVDDGDGFYICSVKITAAQAATSSGTCRLYLAEGNGNPVSGTETGSLYAEKPRLYRSDLGGMVDNPDRGDSYVPTTSTAVYQSRRNSHVYNGSSRVNRGIFLESEARTNLITHSNDFSSWSMFASGSITITTDQGTGPDGAASLDLLEITDATNELHGLQSSYTVTSGATYANSVYLRDDDQRYVSVRYYTGGNNWIAAVFDLQSGTVTQQSAGSFGTILSAQIQDLGAGLYRAILVGSTTSGTSGSMFVSFVSSGTPTLSTTDGVEAYAGTAGLGFYAGFAQAELGSTPSSYIPTSGSTATRAAETLTIAAADMAYDSSAMSFQMDGLMTYADTASASQARWLEWLTGSEFVVLDLTTTSGGTGALRVRQNDGSGEDNVTGSNQFTPGTNVEFNIASRHTDGAVNGAVGGSALTENTDPTGFPDLSATDVDVANIFMGHIGQFRQWAVDLGDSGLETATS
jgi:hypothetical protein